jgi:hypothetical protein
MVMLPAGTMPLICAQGMMRDRIRGGLCAAVAHLVASQGPRHDVVPDIRGGGVAAGTTGVVPAVGGGLGVAVVVDVTIAVGPGAVAVGETSVTGAAGSPAVGVATTVVSPGVDVPTGGMLLPC